MDLTEFDLNTLEILWQTSNGNLDFKAAVENELRMRIVNNTIYSREYLFNVSQIQNHALGINFIPTSEAYNNYGPNITVSMLLDDEELIELGQNFIANPPVNTFGNIKAKALVKDSLTTDQINNLETIGFDTSNILSVLNF